MRRIGLFTLGSAAVCGQALLDGPDCVGTTGGLHHAQCWKRKYYLCAAIRGSARRMAPVACITR